MTYIDIDRLPAVRRNEIFDRRIIDEGTQAFEDKTHERANRGMDWEEIRPYYDAVVSGTGGSMPGAKADDKVLRDARSLARRLMDLDESGAGYDLNSPLASILDNLDGK